VSSALVTGKEVAAAPGASGRLDVMRRAPAVPADERLARYVGSLRVEIAGPLAADSLSRLLELVK
jgi:hypothetical protein